MFPNRLLRIFLHPVFIGFALTLALVVFTPEWFSQYKIEIVSSGYFSNETYDYFQDIDQDGTSEKIRIDLNNPRMVKFEIFKDKGIINSFKIAQGASGGNFLYTGSLTNKTSRELFVFTSRNDSLFVSIIQSSNLPIFHYSILKFVVKFLSSIFN